MQRFPSYSKLLLFALGLFFIGCSSDDEGTVSGQFTNGVFIVNEGNFTEADGSLSFYNKSTKEASLKVYEEANGTPLSGVFQSLAFYNDRGYLIDNTGSLEVFDEKDLKAVTTIIGDFEIPRNFAAVGDKGYISDWGPYDGSYKNTESFIAVLNLESLKIEKTLSVDSRPEGMIVYKNKVFVGHDASNFITIINPTDDSIEKVDIAHSAKVIRLDASNIIWILTGDNKLIRFNPDNKTIEETVELSEGVSYNKLEIDATREKLYLLSISYEPDYSTVNKLYAFDIKDKTLNTEPIFSKKNINGLGVDQETGIIYAADNNAIQGNGTVIRFNPDGTEIDNFAVGRNPNGFVFK